MATEEQMLSVPSAADGVNDEVDSYMDTEGKEVKITDDGGVFKKILVPGQGWEKPEGGDEVYVHYVGTLEDGTKFDSSRDRDEPFSFKLGEGRVIKGWDLGVATMKRGEKSVLTCKAEYAYGAAGSPPKIPPGATLNFEVELLRWKSDKDISEDGGVIKIITTEGTGWQKPGDKDEVTIVYSIKVAGLDSVAVSSPADGVEFTLGDEASSGHPLIRALPLAVKTMKKGETASLTVKPEYGYGAEGREGVPPNSTLDVELTLVSWKTVEDVTPDGAVVKKILVESSQWKTPNEGAQVTVRLVGRLADGTVFESHPEGQELQFTTDEEVVPEGVDLAVMRMKEGERALVTVQPAYGYGDAGRPEGGLAPVPAGAVLSYDIELVNFVKAKDTWEMSESEKVEAAKARKEKANKAYREGKTERAIKLYDRTVLLVTEDRSMSEEVKRQAREVRTAVQLNLAAAHLKLHSWKDAATQATKVLEHDPTNVKALYRRAQAFMGQGDLVEAEIDVKRGLLEQPENADLAALHRKLKVTMRDQAKKESALYSKMFKAAEAAKPAVERPAPVVEAAPQPVVAM